MSQLTSLSRLVIIGAIITAAACTKSDSPVADTTGAARGDTAMAGMDHSNMNRPTAKDADHEFLRMMVDHHEGFIQMATAAMTRASTPAIQGEAHKMHTKQADEQKQMQAMAQSMHGETVMPMVMPSNKTMNDALAGKTGVEFDRAFYANVIAHHREGIKMTDDLLPKMVKAEVKQMAEKMKADQLKEISEMERKMK